MNWNKAHRYMVDTGFNITYLGCMSGEYLTDLSDDERQMFIELVNLSEGITT